MLVVTTFVIGMPIPHFRIMMMVIDFRSSCLDCHRCRVLSLREDPQVVINVSLLGRRFEVTCDFLLFPRRLDVLVNYLWITTCYV